MASVIEIVPGGRSRFRQYIRSNDIIRPIKIDLDIYLEEGVFIFHIENGEDSDANFDALGWWKSNGLKYHILSKMTWDILVVLISTVASKSSFNAGGRVIKPHRASLLTDTIQMLLYGSDWVRALHSIKIKSQIPVSYFMIMLFYLFPSSFLLIIFPY